MYTVKWEHDSMELFEVTHNSYTFEIFNERDSNFVLLQMYSKHSLLTVGKSSILVF